MTGLMEFCMTLARMSLTSTVVILAVCLLRLCLKKAPKKYSYWLWAAVWFRLACPFSISSIFSLFNFSTAPNVREMGPVTEISYLGVLRDRVGQAVQAAAPTVEGVSPADPGFAWRVVLEIFPAIALLWAAGMAVMLTWAVVSYIKTRRRVSTAVKLRDNIYQCDGLGSPFVLGFIKPKIYIPFGLWEEQQAYVLAHEEVHVKRRDYLVKPFAFLLLVLHWLNPLVWLAFHLMSKDMELSCDEKVLSEMEEDSRRDYSLSLLSFAENKRFPAPNPLAFGETGVKDRVKNVMKYRKAKVWVSVLAAVVCVAALVACGTNPASIGIIGGADGPTAVWVGGEEQPQLTGIRDEQDEHAAELLTRLFNQPDPELEASLASILSGGNQAGIIGGADGPTQVYVENGDGGSWSAPGEGLDDMLYRYYADCCPVSYFSMDGQHAFLTKASQEWLFGPFSLMAGGRTALQDVARSEGDTDQFRAYTATVMVYLPDRGSREFQVSISATVTEGGFSQFNLGEEYREVLAYLGEGAEEPSQEPSVSSSSASAPAYQGEHISIPADELEAGKQWRMEQGASEEEAEEEAVKVLARQYILAYRAAEAGISLSREDYREAAETMRETMTGAGNYREALAPLLQRLGMTEEEYWESRPDDPAFQRDVLVQRFLEQLQKEFEASREPLADWDAYKKLYLEEALRDEHLKKVE